MRPIVLATDGSPSAAEATLLAVELAGNLGAPLVAVAVEHVAVPSYGYYGYSSLFAELTKVEHDHVVASLQQAHDVAAESGVECDTVHLTGSIVDGICKVARQGHARMIVIGAHGWGPIRRALHGSVSTAVLHEAPCPVLVVRGGPETLLHPDALEHAAAAS